MYLAFLSSVVLYAQQGEYIDISEYYYDESNETDCTVFVTALFDADGYISSFNRHTVWEKTGRIEHLTITGKREGENYIVSRSLNGLVGDHGETRTFIPGTGCWHTINDDGTPGADVYYSDDPPNLTYDPDRPHDYIVSYDQNTITVSNIHAEPGRTVFTLDDGRIRTFYFSRYPDSVNTYTYKNKFCIISDNDSSYSSGAIITTNHKFRSWKVNAALVDFLLWSEDDLAFPLILGLPFEYPIYTASSHLIEDDGSTVYDSDNLHHAGNLPWASAYGKGIGDIITINLGKERKTALHFINGYTFAERPDLYAKNSRLRSARVTNRANGRSLVLDVADVGDEQLFDLSSLFDDSGNMNCLDFEVISVYPGSKYDDLCIQMMSME